MFIGTSKGKAQFFFSVLAEKCKYTEASLFSSCAPLIIIGYTQFPSGNHWFRARFPFSGVWLSVCVVIFISISYLLLLVLSVAASSATVTDTDFWILHRAIHLRLSGVCIWNKPLRVPLWHTH